LFLATFAATSVATQLSPVTSPRPTPAPRSSIVDTGCARMCTRRRALPAFIPLSVPRRSRLRSGDAPSHVSRSPRKQAHSKPRCRVRRHRKSTNSARRSPSFRTPGLKSDAGFGNFAAEGNKKQAWKLRGPALVTTSSGYLAHAARSLTRLSLLPRKERLPITDRAVPDSNCFLLAATIQKEMTRCTFSATVSSDRCSFR
jgi:hypothetical protein